MCNTSWWRVVAAEHICQFTFGNSSLIGGSLLGIMGCVVITTDASQDGGLSCMYIYHKLLKITKAYNKITKTFQDIQDDLFCKMDILFFMVFNMKFKLFYHFF